MPYVGVGVVGVVGVGGVGVKVVMVVYGMPQLQPRGPVKALQSFQEI